MLMAQFLVCPAPEGLRIAKVTGLRNCHPMEQGFHSFRYPISHPACSTTEMSFFYANLETSERAWCLDFWHRGLPRMFGEQSLPSLGHNLLSCSCATPRQLTFIGDLILKRPPAYAHLIWQRRNFSGKENEDCPASHSGSRSQFIS